MRYVATRVQPWAERRAPRRLRHRRDDPHPAGRAVHGQPSMLRHDRCHLRQLDPLGHAHEFDRKISVQGAAAARAAVGPMIDDRVGIVAHHTAMALVAELGPARFGLLAPLFAVCSGRLRGRARGLVRTLQTQHQLDQFLAAQPLKIAAPILRRNQRNPTGARAWVITSEAACSQRPPGDLLGQITDRRFRGRVTRRSNEHTGRDAPIFERPYARLKRSVEHAVVERGRIWVDPTSDSGRWRRIRSHPIRDTVPDGMCRRNASQENLPTLMN